MAEIKDIDDEINDLEVDAVLSDQEEYENVVLSSTSEEYGEDILIFEDSLDEVHRERSEDQAVNESNVSVEGSESEAEDKEVLDAEKIISELQSDLEESGRERKEISLPGSIDEEHDQFQMGPPCCTQNLADEDIFLEQVLLKILVIDRFLPCK